MSKTETNVNNLKINRGTYANIQANLSSIGENELIITTDKNIPIPTSNDAGKVVKIDNSGEFALVDDYTSENAASGGTTLSLVTTGEKYVWNNKQDAINSANKLAASNISGLANVATSGSYADLSNKPSIPDAVSGVNDGTNWTSITIGSTTKAIPAGGGTPDSISASTINALFGYAITTTVTNGTASGASFIYTGETATITISPATGYVAPSSVTITNATQVSYDSSTGVLVIGSATGAVSISVVCDVAPAGYTVSVASFGTSPYNLGRAYYSLDDGATWVEITSAGVLSSNATQIKFKAEDDSGGAQEAVSIESSMLGLDIYSSGTAVSSNYTLSSNITDIQVIFHDND